MHYGTHLVIQTLEFDTVFHIGDANPENPNRITNSLEGNMLSVSVNPEDWRRIARLGNSQTLAITGLGASLKMIDMLAVLDNHELKDILISESVKRGYLELNTVYKASYYDSELDGEYYSTHDSYEKACYEYDDPNGVSPMDIYTATQSLCTLMRLTKGLDDHTDLGITQVLKEDMLMDFDGVWWDEELKPSAFSAPRGGLFFDAKQFNVLQLSSKAKIKFN